VAFFGWSAASRASTMVPRRGRFFQASSSGNSKRHLHYLGRGDAIGSAHIEHNCSDAVRFSQHLINTEWTYNASPHFLGVLDLDRAAAFYDAALAPLGFVRVFTDDTAVGYGHEGGGDKLSLKLAAEVTVPGEGFHLAFSAATREQVSQFHASALQHGGRCNGQPGLRPDYGDHYCAAFVVDPDGYRIEAVINGPI
jgi:catechol 2,3-dioxygenase-like lactoylglutathione lyase family enzyme